MVELWKPIIKQYSGRAKSSRKGWKVVMWTPTGRKERSLGKKFTTPEAAVNDILAREQQKPLHVTKAALAKRDRELTSLKKKYPAIRFPRHEKSIQVDFNKLSSVNQRRKLLERLIPRGIKYEDVKGRPLQKHMHYIMEGFDKDGTKLFRFTSNKEYTLEQLYKIFSPWVKAGMQIDKNRDSPFHLRFQERARKYGIKIKEYQVHPMETGQVAKINIMCQFKSA